MPPTPPPSPERNQWLNPALKDAHTFGELFRPAMTKAPPAEKRSLKLLELFQQAWYIELEPRKVKKTALSTSHDHSFAREFRKAWAPLHDIFDEFSTKIRDLGPSSDESGGSSGFIDLARAGDYWERV